MSSSDLPAKRGLRVLFLGDVVGRPGREAITRHVRGLRQELSLDLVIANGENAAGGAGIDAGTAHEIHNSGVDLITLGDHTYQRKGSAEFIEANSAWCIRPYNFPVATSPGKGVCSISLPRGITVYVANLIGRVFIGGAIDCPFRAVDTLLAELPTTPGRIVIIDMHAEATSEKWALARHCDGRVSLIVGTHTHVQTADAQVLPGGTGYITDLGMTGSNTGVIGMDSAVALKRFTGPTPAPYQIAEGEGILSGVLAEIDIASGKTIWIRGFTRA